MKIMKMSNIVTIYFLLISNSGGSFSLVLFLAAIDKLSHLYSAWDLK